MDKVATSVNLQGLVLVITEKGVIYEICYDNLIKSVKIRVLAKIPDLM